MQADVDSTIRQSLLEFKSHVFERPWWGREREAISLYAFGYLQQHCKSGSFLFDPTQIGIEMAVPQIKSTNSKEQVCKDLVIWPQPFMTCWNEKKVPCLYPTVIMEWKANKSVVSADDVRWLQSYSTQLPDFVGYAVCLDLLKRSFELSCSRICKGKVISNWIEEAR
jgi:hypothetical protein